MRKTALITILLFPFLSLSAQKKKKQRIPSDTWWTLYGSTQVLRSDVYITAKQPAVGFGSGQTLVFAKSGRKTQNVWLGFDFNQHYFGRKQIDKFRVFYESWQLSFITRLSFPGTKTITPFIDFSGGVRLLVSFTADGRTYGGLLFRRVIDILNKYDSPNLTDHRIVLEYDRFMPVAGISGGFWLKGRRNESKGLSIKGSVMFGTLSKYADYRRIISGQDTYNYTIGSGSGTFFNIQIGYTVRL